MEHVISQADLDEVRKVAQNLIDQDVYGGGIILALVDDYETRHKENTNHE